MIDDVRGWVLTIPRLADRLAACRAAWRGIDLEPVLGVDYLDHPYSAEAPRIHFDLSVLLGHCRMWRRAREAGAHWNLFVEDGTAPVVPLAELRRLVNAARSYFAWDVLRLDAPGNPQTVIGWLDRRRSYTLGVPDTPLSAGAYLCHRDVLDRLLRSPWLCPADRHTSNCGRNLSVYPAPVKKATSSWSADRATVTATTRPEAFDAPRYVANIPYHSASPRIAAVTCHFNPHNAESRRRCYATFAQQFPRIGLELFTAEGSLDDRWEIPEGPNVWRFAMDPAACLFAKENLLNLAIARLPDRFDRVLWIDSDVVLLADDYAELLAAALDQHIVVQGFSELSYIDGFGHTETDWRDGIACANARAGKREADSQKAYVGLAWAASRQLLAQVGGLYDRVITGGGDNAWCTACYGGIRVNYMCHWSAALIADVLRYGDRVAPLVPSVGYVPSRGVHLYHGHLSSRMYCSRNKMLRELEFDPNADLEYAPNGTIRWSGAAPERLRQAVRDYMHGRREDE